MYTLQPVADLTNYHGGFVVWLIIAVIIVVASVAFFEDYLPVTVVVACFCIAMTFHVGYRSFYNPGYTPPKNEKVIGELVGDYGVMRNTGGKTNRTYIQPYVVYRVPEGEVSFPRSEGALYPNRAIIYKN